jgi:hypothetical protein
MIRGAWGGELIELQRNLAAKPSRKTPRMTRLGQAIIIGGTWKT